MHDFGVDSDQDTKVKTGIATEEQPSDAKQLDLFSALRMPHFEVPEVKTPTISLGITQILGLYDTNGACYHFHQKSGESDQQFLMRVSQLFHEALTKELENARKMEAIENGMPKITLGKSIDEILA